MTTRATFIETTREFLIEFSEASINQFGPKPIRNQTSTWMVRTSPTGTTSQSFERESLDTQSVFMWYQTSMRGSTPAKGQLEQKLAAEGVQENEFWYLFILPLVSEWLRRQQSLTWDETSATELLEEFADAVVDGRIISRSLGAISSLGLSESPLTLEDGVDIRFVTEEELWEYGIVDSFLGYGLFWERMPTPEWTILEIELQGALRDLVSDKTIQQINRSVLVGLRLASPGKFEVRDLGRVRNFGVNSLGRTIVGGEDIQNISRLGEPYSLNTEVAQRLKGAWPRLRNIMDSTDHYLRLPAQRLFDAGQRLRPDDAIIDYAVGLESLLTARVQDELRYRFSLRGATILTWEGGAKREVFDQLKDFYDTRSLIIHGGNPTQIRLEEARDTGETLLRDVWRWYFENSISSLNDATSVIDDRILN